MVELEDIFGVDSATIMATLATRFRRMRNPSETWNIDEFEGLTIRFVASLRVIRDKHYVHAWAEITTRKGPRVWLRSHAHLDASRTLILADAPYEVGKTDTMPDLRDWWERYFQECTFKILEES